MAVSIFPQAVGVGLMVLLVAGPVVMGCSVKGITDKIVDCITISANDLIKTNANDVLSSYCKDIECNMKCYIDAIGDCYKQDALFTLNPVILKATSRAFCNNHTETLATLTNCQWSDPSCLSDLVTAAAAASAEYTNKNYAAYKSQYCSALTTVVGCVGFSVTSSCPVEMATLAENFYKASFSYTTCGIPAHAYFSKYGGDVTCGGGNLYQSLTAVIVYLSIFVIGQFL